MNASLHSSRALLLIVGLFAVCVAKADPALIRELENLKASLGPNDRSRSEISLRLADLYFFEAKEATRKADLDPAAPGAAEFRKQASKFQSNALKLYREQLAQSKQPQQKTKLEFQIARLLQDRGEVSEAKPYWQRLAEQTHLPKIRSEAVLRLGEISESEGTPRALADAEKYYEQAISECQAGDLCSYIRFRLAWLLRNQERMPAAIAMMKSSLYDGGGQIREDSLRDLIVFYAAEASDGAAALAAVDEIAARSNRPELIEQLGNGFFSNGNKVAGIRVIELIDSRTPRLDLKVRLLEEYYGQRDWERFGDQLRDLSDSHAKLAPAASDDQRLKSETLLRRLAVQLDGERISDREKVGNFQAVALLYLALFPTHPQKFKLIEGWIAAETDPQKKEAQIADWLRSSSLGLTTEQQIVLREIRLASAQKDKRLDVVKEEAAALGLARQDKEKRREAEYILARAQYELKEYEAALAGFQKLARVEEGQPDRWALLSQNLALDILAMLKDYARFEEQALTWLNHPRLQADSNLKKELSDMARALDEAKFESAVREGATPSALTIFAGFCSQQKLLPKSCDNAKVIAVQLKDQKTLIEVLRLTDAKTDLANEYENGGYFAEAARTLEGLHPIASSRWTPEVAIKIALLYELAGLSVDRDRWLRGLVKGLKKGKSIQPSEELVFQTLRDAQLLSEESTLSLPWSEQKRGQIAHELELAGQGTKLTRKWLMDSKIALGPAWSRMVLERAAALDESQRKAGFYGSRSREKFQKRIRLVQELERFVKSYLEGADLRTRIALLEKLQRALSDLGKEILDTPLPEGLTAEALEQIQASLVEMASPFQTAGKDYDRLAREQIAQLSEDAERMQWERRLGGDDSVSIPLQPFSPAQELKALNQQALEADLAQLRSDPWNVAHLQSLKQRYADHGQHRLASYFEGRILELKERSHE